MKLRIVASVLTLTACQAEFRSAYLPEAEATASSSAGAPALAGPAADPPPNATAASAVGVVFTPAAPAAAVTATSAGSAASPAPETAAPLPAAGAIKGTISVRPKSFVSNMSNLVVWIENPPPQQPTKDAGEKAILDQHGMNFLPSLTVVRVGGKVTFLNDDPFPHNVFTPDREKFNLGTMPHGSARVHEFDQTGRYTLLCNLHPNMIAYILVTPSSWFARAERDGSFTIPAVPAGTYTLKAWGPRLGEQTQSFTVKDGNASIEFHLQPAD